MKRGIPTLMALAAMLVAPRLAAQAGGTLPEPTAPEGQPAFGTCTEPRPIAGTVRYSLGLQARNTNAQFYGAAAFAERVLLPGLERYDFTYGTDVNATYNAVEIPSVEVGDCDRGYRYSLHALDVASSATGIALRHGNFGFFYAGSITQSRLGSNDLERNAVPYLLGIGTSYGAYIAWIPGINASFNEASGPESIATDFIVGGQYQVPGELGWVRAGFVGSTGAYTNLTVAKIRAFVSAALTDKFEELSYLRAGLDKLLTPIGATSLYARKLQFASPKQISASSGSGIKQNLPNLDFVTAHLEQLDIGDLVDLEAAYTIEPEPALHTLQVGGHTPNFFALEPGRGDPEKASKGGDFDIDEPIPVLRAKAGYVQMPDLWFYGIEGGGRFTASLDAALTMGGRISVGYGFRYNDPEILAIFPYAIDAIHHRFTIRALFPGEKQP